MRSPIWHCCSYAVNTQMLKTADFREKTEVIQNKGKVSIRDSMQKYRWSLNNNTKRNDKSWKVASRTKQKVYGQIQKTFKVTQHFSCTQTLNSKTLLYCYRSVNNYSGHRNLLWRWKTKKQLTSENNVKQELLILDTSQGLENTKVK